MRRIALASVVIAAMVASGCARSGTGNWRGWDQKYDTRGHSNARETSGLTQPTEVSIAAGEEDDQLNADHDADRDQSSDHFGFTDAQWWTPRRKVTAFNIGSAAAIATFGTLSWDYGSQSFRFGKEGWFGSGTGSGGADKLGHAWGFYAATHAYTVLFEHWGLERDDAINNAAFSAWLQGLLVEVGDGFSREHGFSYEDLLSNTAGIAFAYLRLKYPRLRETVDYRVEWVPTSHYFSSGLSDPFTDYDGQKYLLAFKVGNILRSDSPFLKAMEIHTGYYTRNFTSAGSGSPKRYAYAAVGLNVTYLLEQTIDHNAWNLFDYFQVPYTYVPARHSFD